MSIKPVPDGFHAITPYLFAEGASRLIEFISAAFSGEVTFRKARPDGAIMHAEMRIGDSMLMVAGQLCCTMIRAVYNDAGNAIETHEQT